jgi:Holliday junction resolvase RusA-like endonuclease
MVDAGVLKDDGAIVELALAKYYAAEPKVVVDIDIHPVFDS